VEVHLNIGSASEQELSGSQYTDGVGLFRTEIFYMETPQLPTEDAQF
jgi:phosphoenolpyruvate-protein kinase (PTS system EI component)